MSEPMHREHAGQIVRRAWVEWARRQPNPKASWLVPWEGLSEPDREVDRQIGEAVIAGEVDIRASYLVAQLGWEWEAFERAARNAASSVLRKALQIFESPPTGDERVDALAMGAAIWIKAELAWRDGPIWNDRKSTPSAAPAVTAPTLATTPHETNRQARERIADELRSMGGVCVSCNGSRLQADSLSDCFSCGGTGRTPEATRYPRG